MRGCRTQRPCTGCENNFSLLEIKCLRFGSIVMVIHLFSSLSASSLFVHQGAYLPALPMRNAQEMLVSTNLPKGQRSGNDS